MECKKQCTDLYIKNLLPKKRDYLDFETEEKITWCSGCGNYGIQNALKRALALEGFKVKDFVLFFDIGCNGNGSDKFHAYTFHGLHGRVLPVAAGACLANHKVKVIASAGDGAMMSEGVNHLVHAVRSNYPMVFILHNNQNYGLTTGQASATTRKGHSMNGSPDGVFLEPMNPSEFVMSLNPTFVARTFSGDTKHMTKILQMALQHNGFAFVEVLQGCPTYNKATPDGWFWGRMKYTEDIKDYDTKDLWAAKKAAHDIYDEMVMGLLYHDPDETNFYEKMPQRKHAETTAVEEVHYFDIGNFIKKFG